MQISLKPILNFIPVLFLLILWSSCTKKPVSPEPAPPGQKKLSVVLDPSFIGNSLVDSVVATWQVNGRQKTVTLSIKGDTVFTDINQLEAGEGKLSIQVFSRYKFGGFYLSQWFFSQQTSISHTADHTISGPKSFSDQQWKPRVELKDGIGHLAVVALRPDDPYFLVKNLPANVKATIVAREYFKFGGGVIRVGGGQWQCNFNCINSEGHVENDQFFSFLPAQMGSSPWNHIEITILYAESEWGEGSVLSMTHTLG